MHATAYQLAWVQFRHPLLMTDTEQGGLVFDPCPPRMPALKFAITPEERCVRSQSIPGCLQFRRTCHCASLCANPRRDLTMHRLAQDVPHADIKGFFDLAQHVLQQECPTTIAAATGTNAGLGHSHGRAIRAIGQD
jgi:hypothetical protein